MLDKIKKSLMKNKKGIILMVIAAAFSCVGQLFWKLAVDKGLLYIVIGFVLYGCGALLMILAYRYGRVSVLQPVLSINYIISLILGTVVLNELITNGKIIGIVIIMLGIIIIAGGNTE